MNQFFRPKAFAQESIGSISLRACGASLIKLDALMANIGGPNNISALFIPALQGKKTILQQIAILDNWETPQPHQFLLRRGDFSNWIDYNNVSFCVECAREGALPWIHDFAAIVVCQRHHCELVSRCDNCHRSLSWSRRGLAVCRCGHVLENKKTATQEALVRNALIERMIVSLQFERLGRVLQLEQTLLERFGVSGLELSIIDSFVEGNVQSLAPIFINLKNQFSNLPPRALTAPLRTCGEWIYPLVRELSTQLTDKPTCPSFPIDPSYFYLTRMEIAFVFGTKPSTASAILALMGARVSNYSTNVLRGDAAAEFYRRMTPAESAASGSSVRELNLTAGRAIKEMIEGRLKIVWFDSQKPLHCARFVPIEQEQEYLTIEEAAQRLATYYDCILNLQRVGLLRTVKRGGRYWFPSQQIQNFRNKYVIAGEIMQRAGVTDRRLSEKIMAFGATPISGPLIDGGKTYVFQRSDIEKLDLRDVAQITHYPTNSGRKKFSEIKNSSCLTSGILDRAVVAKKLGVPPRRIKQFERPDLLNRDASQPASLKTHYDKHATKRTISFVTSAVPIDDIAKTTGMSSAKILARHKALIVEPLVKLSGDVWHMGKSAARLVIKHFENYWDADKAAQYLDVNTYDIHNWRNLGHLTPLRSGDDGYIESPMLYRRLDIIRFAHSKIMQQRELTIRRKKLRH